MADPDVVICAPVRTAIGTFAGTLKDRPAADLGATAIRAAMGRTGLHPDKVDGVVMRETGLKEDASPAATRS